MLQPPFLKAGDTIGILSTARKTEATVIEKASHLIEHYGYRVKKAPNLFAEDRQFAGTDAQRIADMHTLLQDGEVKAIICARGGYGTTRIVDQIDWSLLQKQPKWICGFSDVTAILCHLQSLGIESLHCTMAALFEQEAEERLASTESIFKLLEGAPLELSAASHPFNRLGEASGELIGGNLSILNNLIGTLSDPDYSGKILFMEDLDEYLYHIDRMMVRLKRCGKLSKLAGVVVGYMSDMNDNAIPFGKSAYEIIKEHLEEYSFPVAYGFPIGHEPLNLAVPVGRQLNLKVFENGSSLIQPAGV
jgi:muramoyltetrapeptide carboxypeptidase